MATTQKAKPTLDAILFTERKRLVRFCARLTGDATLAEDLAQETLLVAWQNEHQLRDPAHWVPWVNGIARNLCRYWWRKQQTVDRLTKISGVHDSDAADELANVPDAFDVEIELERQELALLLDRALAQLPPLTRTIFIERYIHEAPQAEVAHRLGVSEGAVEARIQRGKLTLRRILTTDLQEDAAAFGVGIACANGLQKTRLWCPSCGERYLQGRFLQNANQALLLHCSCGFNSCTRNVNGLFDGIRGYRAAMTRAAHWRHTYLQTGLREGSLTCLGCSQPVQVPLSTAPNLPPPLAALVPVLPDGFGLWAHCLHCDWWQQVDAEALASNFPATQAFWRKHNRIYTPPPRQVDYDGAPALVLRFQAHKSLAQIDLC